ncbi:type II toxin-antitoxin system VapC family toxin [Gordonia sp. X0973]|uniref:type II toxin-antitoxin system VapC family toxin n=1 Tax=Gordonia sp. X0973 TaxID=2742602 RepID=UPI000F534307|nr:type II toxin-antitoxin system VapC family toxin [Gordonia sp. X0973]QKT06689.1 type II toxin-antitoxin system VapC family toxin [Gordonia sp. X0973]
MIVLDTNVISEVLRKRPDPSVLAWMESLTGEVAITAMTAAELLAGVRRLPAGKRRAALGSMIETVLRTYRDGGVVLPFDEGAAAEYAEVLFLRERVGLPITTADAQIAAICRSKHAVCATRNVRDFAKTGIELVDPWATR